MPKTALLVLEDGSVFEGRAVGADGRARGKLVSYAGASGFPDLMTDPSYLDAIVCFTHPHVGNPGVGPADYQSERPWARAAVMREISAIKSNRLGVDTFDGFLKNHHVPGMDRVDTRRLARLIYEKGPQAAALGSGEYADAGALAAFARGYEPRAPVAREFNAAKARAVSDPGGAGPRLRVTVHDFGVKRGFLRRLAEAGCEIRLVPHDHPAEDSLAGDADGVVFSSGPGDPAAEAKAVGVARALLGKKPLWGVGVGAGVLALAAGAGTFRDGRGHYGAQGVGRRDGGPAGMTMQCHDFWIDPGSLAAAGLEASHFHLDDGTVEGFASEELALAGVLFHPESEPGPRDSLYLFERFAGTLRERRAGR